MGTYTSLTVAGYPLISSKSEVIPEVMTVFRETDRRTAIRRISERNPLVFGESEDQDFETAVDYVCLTRHAIERLDIMGFGLHRVRQNFEAARQDKLDMYQSWAEDRELLWFAEERDLFKNLTFDDYARALGVVIAESLIPKPFDDYDKPGLDQTTKYILEHDDYPERFGLLYSDDRLLLRLACELVDPETHVVQDITDLIGSGYYGDDEPVCGDIIRHMIVAHTENAPCIILTEGSTDRALLHEALSLLHPHLLEYYSFLNFEASRSPGGAGHLVSLVKAFAGAGIANRVIALFDNDTAAHDATRALSLLSLPPNIVILYYPNLPLLREYPTLGPNGVTSLDVNGLAGGIELYLGRDILEEPNQTLAPVQWKGYNGVLKKYHGEVTKKGNLRDAFFRRAARCRADPTLLNRTDWTGLAAILQMVFHAFE